MIKVVEANVKFNDAFNDVKFATKDEVHEMFEKMGTENLDEVTENLDAVCYVPVNIESLGGDGYLFIF